MKSIIPLAALLALLSLSRSVDASISYGTLNNFDCVNDTGVEAHGFDIELEGVRSTDITYTYDYNHYGVPKITEDNTDPLHPKVLVRYVSSTNPDGSWAAYTAIPSGPIAPTQGHDFTNPAINFGGEHFGVGYYGAPTAVRYNWLIDDGTGNLAHGAPVNVSTPTFVYSPPLPAAPANVVAVIVPPPPPELPVLRFGDAYWVRSIKTTTHSNKKVELRQLVGDDADKPQPWANGEPDEVEVEWRLLQQEFSNPDNPKGELQGAPEYLPGGDETITRRYEFYKYTGPFDAESGEAMADAVARDGVHGTGSVTFNSSFDFSTGEWVEETVDLSQVEVVGEFFGAQMSGFDVAPGLGLIDNLQDGEMDVPYTPRTLVIGGTLPIITSISEPLPAGLSFDPVAGVLSGTPTTSGTFKLTVHSTDANGSDVSKIYSLKIVGNNPAIVPDQVALPDVVGECEASISTRPTANAGTIIATTTDLLTYSAQGTYVVTWTYSDANGGTLTQTQTVHVQDTGLPVPDVDVLPDVSGQCSAMISAPPTASDDCTGKVTGTTADALSYATQGDHVITWTFADGNGNLVTQTQSVRVHDTIAPVPDLVTLPTLSGVGAVSVTSAPTATDNCVGKITGTTTDPLNYSSPGTYTITWNFADGNGNSAAQTQTVTVTSPTKATTLTYSGATSAIVGGSVTFKATLKTATGAALAGQNIRFVLGSQSVSAVTNNKGLASVSLVLNQPSGAYTIQTSFAGTTPYASCGTSSAFVINPKRK